VFTRCAGPPVSLLQGQLLVRQSTFLQAHFGQVSALERQAAETIAMLERMAGGT
jgi:hypothetical protein